MVANVFNLPIKQEKCLGEYREKQEQLKDIFLKIHNSSKYSFGSWHPIIDITHWEPTSGLALC